MCYLSQDMTYEFIKHEMINYYHLYLRPSPKNLFLNEPLDTLIEEIMQADDRVHQR